MGRRCFKRFVLNVRVVLFGHILNPLWLSRKQRRRIRAEASGKAIMSYLGDYREFAASLGYVSQKRNAANGDRNIFSIWLQGEENAPEIVKACWRSVRANCRGKFTVLDENSLGEYIQLPDYILEKWRSGRMKPAHFTDICRVELLSRYGGLWLDATDFIPSELPQWLWDEEFFVYLSGENLPGCHSYVQNCFIRAESSSFLIRAWHDMIFEYWRREDTAADYFIHQLLFRFLVENNETAAREFGKMRKICQDDTHILWFEKAAEPYNADQVRRIFDAALFQKTEYKSKLSAEIPEGSVAEALVGMYKKRLFLFASFSPSDSLGAATLYYLEALSAFGDVVFRSDSNLPDSDIYKLRNFTLNAAAGKHGEYDFGSYKRAWIWACENCDIQSYDAVYLVNDSVFGPIYDLGPYLRKMEGSGAAFFGMVLKPSRKAPHIQSWFAGMDRRVFLTDEFDEFLRGVTAENDKSQVCIKYENGLYNLAVTTLGADVYAVYEIGGKGIYNKVRRNVGKGLPFIKKSSFPRHNMSLASQIRQVLEKAPAGLRDAIIRELSNEFGGDFWGRFSAAGPAACLVRYLVYLSGKLHRSF